MNDSPDGLLFNMQRYSVHDGQGIRTLLFLKGCPLRCRWCSNPESQSLHPELAYNSEKCIGCGYCLPHVPSGVMSRGDDGRMRFHPERSAGQDLRCTAACPAKALIHYGDKENVSGLLDLVEQDSLFYARSGGGLTLSGGEPLSQPDFTTALLLEARRRRIHTAMETSGHAPLETCLQAFALVRELFYDIKHLDPDQHRAATGVDNVLILNNIRMARREFPNLPLTVRTPVVPGVNDQPETIADIARFVRDEVPGARYELLEYHRFGAPKYRYLGRSFPMGDLRLEPGVFLECENAARKVLHSA